MTTDPLAAARALIERLTGYTPGPWYSDTSVVGTMIDDRYEWSSIAIPGNVDRHHKSEKAANARLIAAAPDLHDMVATLADALETERAKRLRAEADREEWKDEYQTSARLLSRYKDAATNRQAERDQALARLAAVKRATKCARCGSDGGFGCYECIPSDEADAALQRVVADALEAERAKVAAAHEAVANIARSHIYYDSAGSGFREDEFNDDIRTLTPSDAQAALDKMLAEARLEGWRDGREAAAEWLIEAGIAGDYDIDPLVWTIRALPEPEEAIHE